MNSRIDQIFTCLSNESKAKKTMQNKEHNIIYQKKKHARTNKVTIIINEEMHVFAFIYHCQHHLHNPSKV
jgi:hypothetical protein